MTSFKINTKYSPAGDQPNAIDSISKSLIDGEKYQTLDGVTGSGKTFTMAKVIEKTNKPTLIMTHNKTLAAQLYSEFKGFFPNNHVEYFISYYDYYQPEAYIPRQDLFIEKDSAINEEIERLRLSATASLLSFEDVICIASVSANYGLGDPKEYKSMVERLEVGQNINYQNLLLKLVDMGYKRNDTLFDRGCFRVNGETLYIYPIYNENEAIRIEFFGDEIEKIVLFNPLTNEILSDLENTIIYASSQFIVGKKRLANAVKHIEAELEDRLQYFKKENKLVEHQRLKQRVEFDLEMIETTGMCKGIENYARFLTGKKPGETPFSLLDYFGEMKKDFLLIVDESHVSLPQFRGMYAGDRSRKEVLVEYGFRLPSALDNRPLKFDEFINKSNHYLFVSATPADIELELSEKRVYKQVIRPTGLLDPVIEMKKSDLQVEMLFDEIKKTILKKQRVLVTVLTKKMAEELTKYYLELGIKIRYMHSEIDVIERNQIIRGLRVGDFDVLVGINLLREGLDLPEVSLVAILDADKEGFLRSERSLIQTMGRAARNQEGRVILFCNKMTNAIRSATKLTEQRREIQMAHNKKNGITPKTTIRKMDENLSTEDTNSLDETSKKDKLPPRERQQIIAQLTKKMDIATKQLDFEIAIRYRDEISKIRKL
jgi:excinuclease ABC subunit B